MKKFMLSIVLMFHITLFGQLSWIQKDSLPSYGRYCHISFVIGNKAFAGMGSIDAAQRIYSAGFFSYSPSDDSWHQLPDLPADGRYGSSSFSLNGKGYVCLGVDNNHNWQNDVWEFDPVTEIWVKKSDFSGGSRYSAASFVLNGKAYIVGGSENDGNNYLNDLWCYDPATDSWVQKASLPAEHKSCAVAFTISGKGYVVCGASNTYEPAKDFYEYNPVNDSWTRLPDLPATRTGAVGFVIRDTAYVGTGTDLDYTYKTFWYFTPSKSGWTALPDPPLAFSKRTLGTAFSIGNTGYVLGGRSQPYDPFYSNGKMLNDLWAYTECVVPEAGFTYQQNSSEVAFFDSSSHSTQYYWSFGDGTHSTEINPVHLYLPGIYQVCHIVENECGKDSICKQIQIGCTDPTARFAFAVNYPDVQFSDSSIAGFLISRLWDFGDSSYSAEPAPLHSYISPGVYQVCLTVTDSCGTNSACETIYMLMPLALNVTITPETMNDLQVTFGDHTPGTTYWKWKFGDGDSSDLQNPSHIYRQYGTYHVCLTAGNNQAIGTYCDNLLLSVNPALHQSQPVLVYPNPSEGKLFVRFYKSCTSTDINVVDQNGRYVLNQHLFTPDLMTPSIIDLTKLSPGIYFFSVKCDEYNKTWKIVIN